MEAQQARAGKGRLSAEEVAYYRRWLAKLDEEAHTPGEIRHTVQKLSGTPFSHLASKECKFTEAFLMKSCWIS